MVESREGRSKSMKMMRRESSAVDDVMQCVGENAGNEKCVILNHFLTILK